jgi:hypothetical protein
MTIFYINRTGGQVNSSPGYGASLTGTFLDPAATPPCRRLPRPTIEALPTDTPLINHIIIRSGAGEAGG